MDSETSEHSFTGVAPVTIGLDFSDPDKQRPWHLGAIKTQCPALLCFRCSGTIPSLAGSIRNRTTGDTIHLLSSDQEGTVYDPITQWFGDWALPPNSGPYPFRGDRLGGGTQFWERGGQALDIDFSTSTNVSSWELEITTPMRFWQW